MLRVAGARLLDDRHRSGVHAALDADPVAACMVAARVEAVGLDPWRLGGELWAAGKIRPHISATYPLEETAAALRRFMDRTVVGKVVVEVA